VDDGFAFILRPNRHYISTGARMRPLTEQTRIRKPYEHAYGNLAVRLYTPSPHTYRLQKSTAHTPPPTTGPRRRRHRRLHAPPARGDAVARVLGEGPAVRVGELLQGEEFERGDFSMIYIVSPRSC
jgi:hypothetical protein